MSFYTRQYYTIIDMDFQAYYSHDRDIHIEINKLQMNAHTRNGKFGAHSFVNISVAVLHS